jgi:hypothetical protein
MASASDRSNFSPFVVQSAQVLLTLRFALLRVADVSDLASTYDAQHHVTARLSDAVGGAIAQATAALASAQARITSATGAVRPASPLVASSNAVASAAANAAASSGFASVHESLRTIRTRIGSAVEVRRASIGRVGGAPSPSPPLLPPVC